MGRGAMHVPAMVRRGTVRLVAAAELCLNNHRSLTGHGEVRADTIGLLPALV